MRFVFSPPAEEASGLLTLPFGEPLEEWRVGGQPLGDLLQPGGQLVLADRLTLLPLAVLIPDRPPPAPIPTGRVHRNPPLQLDHVAATPGS